MEKEIETKEKKRGLDEDGGGKVKEEMERVEEANEVRMMMTRRRGVME